MKLTINRDKLLIFNYFASIYLQINFIRYLCLVTFLILVLNSKIRKLKKRLISYYSIWIILFVGFCLISAFWSNHTMACLNNTKGMLEFVIVGPYLFHQYTKDNNLESIIKILAYVGLIFALVLLLLSVPMSQWEGRLITIHYAANSSAVKLMQSALCAFVLWKFNKRHKHMLFVWMFLLLCVVLTGSRTMLLGAIVGTIVILILDIDSKNIIRPLVLLFVALLGLYFLYNLVMNNAILYNAIGYRTELLINSILGHGRTYQSDLSRQQLIHEGLKLFYQKPALGWGSFMFKLESASGAYYAHNNYVELLADFGLVGTILYYSFFVVYLIKGIILRKNIRNIRLSIAIALIISYLIIDFGTVTWYREYTHIIFTLIAALITMETEKESNEIHYKNY